MLLCGLFPIAWIDLRDQRIPNRILWKMTWARVFLIFLEILFSKRAAFPEIKFWMLNFVCVAFTAIICYLAASRGIGPGDVKLIAVLGLYLRKEQVLNIVFLSFIYEGIFLIFQTAVRKCRRKQKLPQGPFVLLSVMSLLIKELLIS